MKKKIDIINKIEEENGIKWLEKIMSNSKNNILNNITNKDICSDVTLYKACEEILKIRRK